MKFHLEKLLATATLAVLSFSTIAQTEAQEIVFPGEYEIMWVTQDLNTWGTASENSSENSSVKLTLYQWQETMIDPIGHWEEVTTVYETANASNAWSHNFNIFDYFEFGRSYSHFGPGGVQVGFGWVGLHRLEMTVGNVTDTHDFWLVMDSGYGPGDL